MWNLFVCRSVELQMYRRCVWQTDAEERRTRKIRRIDGRRRCIALCCVFCASFHTMFNIFIRVLFSLYFIRLFVYSSVGQFEVKWWCMCKCANKRIYACRRLCTHIRQTECQTHSFRHTLLNSDLFSSIFVCLFSLLLLLLHLFECVQIAIVANFSSFLFWFGFW